MISLPEFGAELKSHGFDFYSGVPCSYLKYLINYAINECEYIGATNEGEAVAIAAGASLGQKKSVVLMQNSGLTNAVSPLVSLIQPFRIPILGFVSLRGEPGMPDEPQHELMGEITPYTLDLLQIEWDYLSTNLEKAKLQLQHANEKIEHNEPYFFIVKKGTFEPVVLQDQTAKTTTSMADQRTREDQLPARYDVLSEINSLKDNHTIQLATTGKTGRELYDLEDAPNNLYMVGSMGCVSSIGLGLALAKKEKSVIAIDGDGALLMRLGNLPTNGYWSPSNLLHILLDNNVHDSTGGQQTVSGNVDFVEVAAACGYNRAIYVHNLAELKECIVNWKKNQKLTFLYMRIAPGSKKSLGRPTLKPHEVKERLQVFISD